MNKPHLVLSLAFFALASNGPASEVLFSTPPESDDFSNAAHSDTAPHPQESPPIRQQVSGVFNLASPALVERATWHGFYLNSPTINSSPEFLVRFFTSESTRPSQYPFYEIRANVSLTARRALNGSETFSLQVVLPEPLLISSGERMWFSVVEDDPRTVDTFRWFQTSNRFPIGRSSRGVDGEPWVNGLNAENMSFTLEGTLIPEPITSSILLLGLLVGAYGPRRKS